MRLPYRQLLLALAFGLGAVVAPAAIIMFEGATAPRPELHDAAYARSLLSQGRLSWEDQRAMAGGSAVRGPEVADPGAGN